MKKIIFLIIIVLVIVGVLKMIGVDISVSLSPDKDGSEIGLGEDDIFTVESWEAIIGAPLPSTATDTYATTLNKPCAGGNIMPKRSWVVAKLPKEDFYSLVERLDLVKNPDLLEFWPEAFECQEDRFRQFWDITPAATEDTYFGKGFGEEMYRVFKYENGKLYIKKVTRYVTLGITNGQLCYEKKGPAAIEYIIGTPLPNIATDIDVFSYRNFNFGNAKASFWIWAVAKLPKEDFDDLVEKLKLVERPDLLEVWPDAFDMAPYDFNEKWGYNGFWDVTNTVDEDTYFGESAENESQMVFKYENGKLYIKKEITYLKVGTGQNQHWEKAKKSP